MKNYRTYGVAGAALVMLSVASLALAQTTLTASSTVPTTSSIPPATSTSSAGTSGTGASNAYPAPMVVDVSNTGNILLRGVVQSVGANSVTITSWGGTWTIRTTAQSSVVPTGPAGAGDLSSINVGDFVGVQGIIASDQSWTVNAIVVRDWTTNPYTASAANQNQSSVNSSTSSSSPAPTPPTSSTPSGY